jgi:hypothetical protein
VDLGDGLNQDGNADDDTGDTITNTEGVIGGSDGDTLTGDGNGGREASQDCSSPVRIGIPLPLASAQNTDFFT